jgi:ribosomal-protein-alanine N-acetyltransferase
MAVESGRPSVRVRPPRAEDGNEYVALNRASRAFHAGLASPPLDRRAFHRLLDRLDSPTYRYWLIERRADRAIVGAVELSQIARGNFRSAYLGYQIGAPFARRGYMREALATVLTQAFGRLRLHRVEANIQPENAASIRLVRGLSFRREGLSRRYLKIRGRWRDHGRWALLAEDWRAFRRRPRPL